MYAYSHHILNARVIYAFVNFITGIYKIKDEEKLPVWIQAPENVFESIHTRKSDMFMFGLMLWELLNDQNWSSPREMCDKKDIKKGEFRVGFGTGESQAHLISYVKNVAGVNDDILSFIRACLSFDASERPSASDFMDIDPYNE